MKIINKIKSLVNKCAAKKFLYVIFFSLFLCFGNPIRRDIDDIEKNNVFWSFERDKT